MIRRRQEELFLAVATMESEFLLSHQASSARELPSREERFRSTIVGVLNKPRSIVLLLLCTLLAVTPMVALISSKHFTSRRNLEDVSSSTFSQHQLYDDETPLLLPPPLTLVSLSPLLLAPASHPMMTREAIVSALLKPIVMELGAVFLCQAVGLPLLSKLGFVLRRVRAPSYVTRSVSSLRLLHRFPIVSRTFTRPMRIITSHSGRAWKAFGHFYKQTSLSKIVNRSKKLSKVFVHHHDHEEDHSHRHH